MSLNRTPAAFTDSQLRIINRYAASLPLASREPFMETLGAQLTGEVANAALFAALTRALDAVKESLP